MCQECTNWVENSIRSFAYHMPIRSDEDVSAVEWARFAKARRTTDPRKLAAMLPAWIKRHIAKSTIKRYPPFIPHQAPKFPAWTYTSMRP